MLAQTHHLFAIIDKMSRELILYIGVVIASSYVLIKAVKLFIASATQIALSLGISAYAVSFFLVAIATSLPETVVGITSAIQKTPILAYSNAVGANIALLTFIIALPILSGTTLSTRHIINSKDVYYSTAFAFLPLILSADGTVTRVDGTILLGTYIFYSIIVLKKGKSTGTSITLENKAKLWKQGIIFVISLSLLLLASQGIVKSAIHISKSLGLTLGFVGLTLTALGTSLPETAFALRAAKDNKQEEILGNAIGSVVANSTFVLGIAALIYPINISGGEFSVSTTFFLIIALLLFLKFTKSKEKIDRMEGIILLALYILFVGIEYYLQL